MASVRFALRRDSPASCPIQAGADTYDRRALLDGDREILRRAHREARQAVGVGELAQGREMAPAVLRDLGERGHRHEAGDPDGRALDERPELGPGDAGLALLPGDVDLHEDLRLGRAVALQLAQRGVRRDGVDELDVREDLLDLAALELADEVPAEAAGARGGLGLELLSA